MNILKKAVLLASASIFLTSFAMGQTTRTETRTETNTNLRGETRGFFPASAQQTETPRAGSREITFSGTGESDRKFENGSLSVESSYGWYATDRWLISARQTFSGVGSSRNWTGSTLVAADYHFFDGAWRPFVGVNGGFRYGGKSVGDSFALGAQAGLKYYVSGGAFLFGRAGYSYTFDDVDDIDDAWDSGRWGYGFGVGLNF